MAPIWVKSLAQRLSEHELVEKAHIWPAKLIVRYTTGVQERYWYLGGAVPPKHYAIGRADATPSKVPVTELFEPGLSESESPYRYYGIGRKAWAAANVTGRALALQRLVTETVRAGYQGSAPPQVLASDWESLRSYDLSQCADGTTIDFYPPLRPRYGSLLIAHYADLPACRARPAGGLTEMAARPRRINYLLRKMVSAKRRLTSLGIMRMLRHRFGPYTVLPSAYALLLSRLGARSLFDPHPETCAKALACAVLGITYYTRPDPLFDAALGRGLAGQVGLDHRYLGDGGVPDFALADWNLTAFDYDEGLGYAGDARRLLIGVPGHMKGEAVADCAPQAIIDCRLCLGARWHVFCW